MTNKIIANDSTIVDYPKKLKEKNEEVQKLKKEILTLKEQNRLIKKQLDEIRKISDNNQVLAQVKQKEEYEQSIIKINHNGVNSPGYKFDNFDTKLLRIMK